MVQVAQLTFDIPIINDTDREDYKQVIKDLSVTCHNCRLSLLHPSNRGLIWKGNPEGKIAVVGEAPGDKETELGVPLVGLSGKEWDRWARLIGLDQKQCLISNVVQCQPSKHKVDGRMTQKAPDKDEIKACFGPRVLRILRAMPNLEVVITLGWVSAKALLGGEPSTKTHEGKWWTTSILPGVAVFCLVHPSSILREGTPEKIGRVEEYLKLFKREYIDTKKVIDLIKQMD